MSDAVLINLITNITSVILGIFGIIIIWIKTDKIKKHVEEYHSQVNGHMEKLLETTKQLATAQEKARAQGEKKK